jgi:hypothetical protein
MDKNCDNCFYKEAELDAPSCLKCKTVNGSPINWVAIDFLKNVPDTPMYYESKDSIEGKNVMCDMVEELNRMNTKQGVKYDSEKPKWTLLPFRALKEVVAVLGFGAKKYAPDNWQRVPDASTRYVDAAFRHLTDWQLKERLDGETGKSHLAHAICCLLFLLWFEQEERVQ